MSWQVLQDVLTFGADGRVQRRFQEYARLVVQLGEAAVLAETRRSEAAKAVEELRDRKREAVDCVRRVALLEGLPEEDRRAFAGLEPAAEDEIPRVTINPPLSAADVGVSLTAAAAGLSTAASLLGVLGFSGTGSVGTTATVLGSQALAKGLAWLGIGGVSGAGLGPAAIAGAVVQGLGVAAASCHRDAASQIGRIEKATASAADDLAKLEALAIRLEGIAHRAAARDVALRRQIEVCLGELDEATRRLEGRWWFGRILEWLRANVAVLMHRRHCDKVLRPLLKSAGELRDMVTRPLPASEWPSSRKPIPDCF